MILPGRADDPGFLVLRGHASSRGGMMKAEKIQVLLVEDNPTDAMVVQEELAHSASAHFSVVHLRAIERGADPA